MTQRYFITGTDTEIGKTHVTCRIAKQLRSEGQSVACFKPLASGAERVDSRLVNEDALKLQQAASVELPMAQVNPYCFEPAIAPHISAQQAGIDINLDVIRDSIEPVNADVVLIEGFGGWLAPVSLASGNQLWQSDIAKTVDAQVILVVGMRLGCLNHAMLTVRQIEQDGLQLHGWVANIIEPDMPMLSENIETLNQLIGPPLSTVDYQPDS